MSSKPRRRPPPPRVKTDDETAAASPPCHEIRAGRPGSWIADGDRLRAAKPDDVRPAECRAVTAGRPGSTVLEHPKPLDGG